nr:hypothetical protein GCM10020092_071410 [Actinoplanes digitatis]
MTVTTPLARAQRVLADQSVTRMFGTRLVSFGEGSATVELDIRPEITNHHGAVHGGIVAYAADNALAFAGGAALGPDVVTSGLTIDYIASARGRTLRAHGMVMRAEGRRAACRCELHAIAEDGTETLVAVAQGTIVAPAEPRPRPPPSRRGCGWASSPRPASRTCSSSAAAPVTPTTAPRSPWSSRVAACGASSPPRWPPSSSGRACCRRST